ncbi:MAG: hypothetical protein R2854_27755 [Caldilineaceae bacterium]
MSIRILDADEARTTILRRRAWDAWNVPAALLDGIERNFGARLTPDEAVRRILDDIRREARRAAPLDRDAGPGDARRVGSDAGTDCRGLRRGGRCRHRRDAHGGRAHRGLPSPPAVAELDPQRRRRHAGQLVRPTAGWASHPGGTAPCPVRCS